MYRTPLFMKRTTNAIDSHRKRAKAAGQRLDYGLDEFREKVIESLRLPCYYCGVGLTDANWSSDHSTPTSRGGSYCLWNVEIVCKHCNEAKGALTHEEFSALLCVLRDFQSQARLNVIQRLRAGARAMARR